MRPKTLSGKCSLYPHVKLSTATGGQGAGQHGNVLIPLHFQSFIHCPFCAWVFSERFHCEWRLFWSYQGKLDVTPQTSWHCLLVKPLFPLAFGAYPLSAWTPPCHCSGAGKWQCVPSGWYQALPHSLALWGQASLVRVRALLGAV